MSMKNFNDTIGNQTRGLSICSATACPRLSMYLIELSLTQVVVAMANVHYFTAGGKSNTDTDRRFLSVFFCQWVCHGTITAAGTVLPT